VQELKGQFTESATLETRARRVVESMALCLQELAARAPRASRMADAFCAFAPRRATGAGVRDAAGRQANFRGIIARSRPQL